jgi:hypothetical protein
MMSQVWSKKAVCHSYVWKLFVSNRIAVKSHTDLVYAWRMDLFFDTNIFSKDISMAYNCYMMLPF